MQVTNYQQWVAAGSPWHPAAFIHDFAAIMRGHGYTVGTIGNVQTHLDVPFPQDHAPFSHTPWPGVQPYPAVLAADIMPDGPVDLSTLGAQIVADKLANVPGTGWIKYINWTDSHGQCWEDRWEPTHQRLPSSDRGHIHVSGRTDFVDQGTSYDPVARITHPNPQGDDVSQADVIAALTSPAGQQLLARAAGEGVHNQVLGRSTTTIGVALQTLLAKVGVDNVDEQAIVTGILAALNPQAIAVAVVAALPADEAKQVVDELQARLAA